MFPKCSVAKCTRCSCSIPTPAMTILSGLYQSRIYVLKVSLVISGSRSSGHSNGIPSVLSLYATVCTSSGRIISGLAQISRISYAAASFWASSSSSSKSGR